MTAPTFSVSNLNAHYGDLQVLWKVDFDVYPSEVLAIIGANGAGKTTLLRSIFGLHRQRTGTIQFHGEDLAGYASHSLIHRGLAYVPDERGIFPDLSVEKNLMIGAFSLDRSRRVAEALGRVYQMFPILNERKHFLAGSLSGGEQQMLALGKGMVTKPQILFLDEPSSGLSPLMVSRLMNYVLEIHRGGTTVVLVEQNVHHALQTSHRAYVLENGRIVLQGPSAELIGNKDVKKAYLGK